MPKNHHKTTKTKTRQTEHVIVVAYMNFSLGLKHVGYNLKKVITMSEDLIFWRDPIFYVLVALI